MKTYLKPAPRITNTTSIESTLKIHFPPPIFSPFPKPMYDSLERQSCIRIESSITRSSNCTPFFLGGWGTWITPSSSHHHLLANFSNRKIQFVSQRKTTSIRTPPLRLPPIFRNSQPANVSGIPLKPQACAFRLKVPTSKGIESHLWFHCDFCTSSQK